ncbi:metal-dependent hydrolase [Leptolyngbya sp. AN02str]
MGHSLAGLATYAITQRMQASPSPRQTHLSWRWATWLLVVASLPDVDYLVPALILEQANQRIRTTHSLLFALLIPGCTVLVLWLLGKRGTPHKWQSVQVVGVGLSHLVLDLLTGVFPLPVLYPFSTQTFRLPFGLLPSAGRIQFTNYFLYRNLLIELGVLLSLILSLLALTKRAVGLGKRLLLVLAGFTTSIGFMVWVASLSR